MPTRTVTGTCFHVDGTAWAGGSVSFELLEAFETATEVYPHECHTETLDGSGQFSITLGVPDTGTAHYEIHTPDGLGYSVYLADGAATDLQTILTIATTAVDQDDLQTLMDAASVLTIRNIAVNDDIEDSDEIVRVTGTTTVTLPAATGSGKAYCIKNVGADTVTVAAQAGDTIDGDASITLSPMAWITALDAAADTWDIIGGVE